MGDPDDGDMVTADSLTIALRSAFRSEGTAASLDFQIQVDAVELRGHVSNGELKLVQIAPPAPPIGGSLPSGKPDLQFATGPDIRHLIAGTLTADQAVQQGVVTIVKGNPKLLGRFTELFRIDA
jgi:hypothetical protein